MIMLVITDNLGRPLKEDCLEQLRYMGYNIKDEKIDLRGIIGTAFDIIISKKSIKIIAHTHGKRKKSDSERFDTYYFFYYCSIEDADALDIRKNLISFQNEVEKQIKSHDIIIENKKESLFLFEQINNVVNNKEKPSFAENLLELSSEFFDNSYSLQFNAKNVESAVRFLIILDPLIGSKIETIRYSLLHNRMSVPISGSTGEVSIFVNMEKKTDDIEPEGEFKEYIKNIDLINSLKTLRSALLADNLKVQDVFLRELGQHLIVPKPPDDSIKVPKNESELRKKLNKELDREINELMAKLYLESKLKDYFNTIKQKIIDETVKIAAYDGLKKYSPMRTGEEIERSIDDTRFHEHDFEDYLIKLKHDTAPVELMDIAVNLLKEHVKVSKDEKELRKKLDKELDKKIDELIRKIDPENKLKNCFFALKQDIVDQTVSKYPEESYQVPTQDKPKDLIPQNIKSSAKASVSKLNESLNKTKIENKLKNLNEKKEIIYKAIKEAPKQEPPKIPSPTIKQNRIDKQRNISPQILMVVSVALVAVIIMFLVEPGYLGTFLNPPASSTPTAQPITSPDATTIQTSTAIQTTIASPISSPTATPVPTFTSIDKKTFTNSIGMEFVSIPAGEYDMGSQLTEKFRQDNEGPVHHVRIGNAFYIGKYEVTQKQWQDIMGAKPSNFKGDDLPVDSVSWNDAQQFIKKLNERENTNKYRLPTEAEWEYAVRATTTTGYYFGNSGSELENYAWYKKNSGLTTHPVGKLKPNRWDLRDTYGNVLEWVQDKWHNSYNGAPTDGSAWLTDGGPEQVLRGCGYLDQVESCRSAARQGADASKSEYNIGFRLVKDL